MKLKNISTCDVTLQYDSKLFICGPGVEFDIENVFPGHSPHYLNGLFIIQGAGSIIPAVGPVEKQQPDQPEPEKEPNQQDVPVASDVPRTRGDEPPSQAGYNPYGKNKNTIGRPRK